MLAGANHQVLTDAIMSSHGACISTCVNLSHVSRQINTLLFAEQQKAYGIQTFNSSFKKTMYNNVQNLYFVLILYQQKSYFEFERSLII